MRSLTFLSAVDELPGVHAFGGDEQFLALLVAVGVAEVHDGERSTTARIVDDILELSERDERDHASSLTLTTPRR